MHARLVSALLLTIGVVVGVGAGVGLLVGFEPARLPAALLNIAAYKLTFLAAFGLLAAGAVLARYARRLEPESANRLDELAENRAPALSPPESPMPVVAPPREGIRVERR